MSEEKEVLSLLIHGASKAGKSTLTSTAPLPLLVIDAEGSWKFIKNAGFEGPPLRRKTWDPMEPPPRHDGTWDVCLVSVASWDTFRRVYAWLSQTEHDFVSIVLDSITEMQRRLKTNLSGDSILKGYDGWGMLLAQMDSTIRGFRDLTLLPGPVRCVIFVAETREESGKWRPYMQGQISVSLPYWVDICGYVFASKIADNDGNPTVNVCNLYVGSHPQFESGERVQGRLPDNIVNPNVSSIMDKVYAEETASE